MGSPRWPRALLLWVLALCACCPGAGIRDEPRAAALGMPAEPPGVMALSKRVSEHAKIMAQHEVRFALALSLLGTVAISSVLVYLANCGNQHIEHCTWQVVSGTLSIFCALLLLGIARRLCNLIAYQLHLQDCAQAVKLGFGFCAFIATVAVFESLLWRHNTCEVQLTALGTLGAHIVGFMGNEVFGNLVGALAHDPLHFVAGAAAVILFYCGLGVLTLFVRGAFVASREEADPDDIEHWLHQCGHVENEFMGFTVGFLLSMVVRYFITWDAPPLHGDPHNKSELQVVLLLEISLAMLLFHIFFSKCVNLCQVRFHSEIAHRAVEVATEISAMTTGWLFLYAANWMFWRHDTLKGSGDMSIEDVRSVCHMTASVLVAVIFSSLSFMFILPLSYATRWVGTRILGDLIGAVVLGVGFSWEVAFYQAIKSMSQEIKAQRQTCDLFIMALSFILCALVLPSWKRIILPHAMERHRAAKELAHQSMMMQLHTQAAGDYGHLPNRAKDALRKFHQERDLGTIQDAKNEDDER